MERKDSNMGKLARFYSRSSLAGSSLISAAAVTVVAGAALSLFHVAFEANNLAATIKRIQAGSPSKRAQVLRMIKEDVKNLPETNVIIAEWEKYLDVMKERLHHQSRSEDEELESDGDEEPDQQHIEAKQPEDKELESDGDKEPDQQHLDETKEPEDKELESDGDEEPDQQHLDETKEPEDEELESDGDEEPDQQHLDGIKEHIHTEESIGDDLD
jgi:hypothetical protein